MKTATKSKKPRRMRREYGIGDFLSWMHSDGGLRHAVRRVAVEDKREKDARQAFFNFTGKGLRVN